MNIQDTNNRFSLWWIVENLLGILLLSALAAPLVAWGWRICITLFITVKQEVFQRNGRDVPEVKSWKNFYTIVFVKAELFSHFHHSCSHPLCSCLFSSKLKLRPTLNLKERPTLFTKSSLPLCSENTGIGNFVQPCKVVKHDWKTYWFFESYTRMRFSSPAPTLVRPSFSFFSDQKIFRRRSVSRAWYTTWLSLAAAWGRAGGRFPQNPEKFRR